MPGCTLTDTNVLHGSMAENNHNEMIYLIGLLISRMDGVGRGELKGPFLTIKAKSEREAEEIYNGRVPLTTYYPCNVIARLTKNRTWIKVDECLKENEMNQILVSINKQ